MQRTSKLTAVQTQVMRAARRVMVRQEQADAAREAPAVVAPLTIVSTDPMRGEAFHRAAQAAARRTDDLDLGEQHRRLAIIYVEHEIRRNDEQRSQLEQDMQNVSANRAHLDLVAGMLAKLRELDTHLTRQTTQMTAQLDAFDSVCALRARRSDVLANALVSLQIMTRPEVEPENSRPNDAIRAVRRAIEEPDQLRRPPSPRVSLNHADSAISAGRLATLRDLVDAMTGQTAESSSSVLGRRRRIPDERHATASEQRVIRRRPGDVIYRPNDGSDQEDHELEPRRDINRASPTWQFTFESAPPQGRLTELLRGMLSEPIDPEEDLSQAGDPRHTCCTFTCNVCFDSST